MFCSYSLRSGAIDPPVKWALVMDVQVRPIHWRNSLLERSRQSYTSLQVGQISQIEAYYSGSIVRVASFAVSVCKVFHFIFRSHLRMTSVFSSLFFFWANHRHHSITHRNPSPLSHRHQTRVNVMIISFSGIGDDDDKRNAAIILNLEPSSRLIVFTQKLVIL